MVIPRPMTADDLGQYTPLEFIMLLGTAGTGKSYSVLSLAEAWQRIKPEGKVYVIDTETGIAKTWKAAFPRVRNMLLYHGEMVNDADKFIEVFSSISKQVTEKDWLCLESDTRIWDMCQDNGWMKVTGQKKDEYLSQRVSKGGPTTPQPDQLWQVVLDLYRRRFRDVLVNDLRMRTNILVTTGLTRNAPRTSPSRRESMKLLNIDVTPDGHGENTRNPDTVIMMSRESDGYWAEVLKDRGSDKPGQQVRFKLENFYFDFMDSCRGGLE